MSDTTDDKIKSEIGLPKDVDLSDGLKNCFGMFEYETLAVKIITLISDSKKDPLFDYARSMGYEDGEGWDRKFSMGSFDSDRTLFAMFGTDGWLSNCYSPRGWFVVSNAFIKRIHERMITEASVHTEAAA